MSVISDRRRVITITTESNALADPEVQGVSAKSHPRL